MKDLVCPSPRTGLRPPSQVMRLHRMGASFPTRLSFLRVLTRRLAAEGARLRRPVWNIGAEGFGHAVYTIALGGHDYSLVAVSTHLPDEMRTDRVIATAWDTAYVLYDGVPDSGEIARICAAAPQQEAARYTERDLVLSRANKSVRLFSHVIERLREGRQPDEALVNEVGYLMRTTAVYGNGKFGIADRGLIAGRPGIEGPFAAEMLTVWLIRSFTHDLVEHLGGTALDPALKRHLGIGNSTGLGMAPFLVSHPVLLNNWMQARETALARVRALPTLGREDRTRLTTLCDRVAAHLDEWQVPAPDHQARIDLIRAEWPAIRGFVEELPQDSPVDALIRRSEAFSVDTQELCVALALEPFGDIVDDLAVGMTDPLAPPVNGFDDAQSLRTAIETHFDWVLRLDFEETAQQRRFWYVSEEKLEPRLGDRFDDPGADRESPLDIARRVQALWHALDGVTDLRAFRAARPEHELALARVACLAAHPYAEIRDNLIAESCLPIDMLRCKLAFFGATKFDPKSDRWTRITLAQGAPLPEDLGTARADDWWLAGLGA
ncbi:hypothetical protein [Mameliella alba]|uniref:hypothetical protein n=1 Tax=Mameliella alba TaxID=561184 RepID=UPI000B530A1D|nr:hypothetical protein [Mameliella alba]MBY6119063.1 hypothetical protein [Mameliella alba]OWV43973.1 hypothetical protein CDZ95_10000 [Mameliella alba]OWV67643.1 hypothetical protein CDZ97_04230 [Mameliella alba]